jgi:hypothetical protein
MLHLRALPALLGLLLFGCAGSQTQTVEPPSKAGVGSVAGNFGLLQSPVERLPAGEHARLRSLLSRGPDAFRPKLIQRVRTSAGSLWVFLHSGELCIAQSDRGAVACSSQSKAIAEGILVGAFTPPTARMPRPHKFVLLGLLPDDMRGVVIKLGAERRAVTVQHNVVLARDPDQPILVLRTLQATR